MPKVEAEWACRGGEHPGWVGGNGFQRSLTFGAGLGWREVQPEWKSLALPDLAC
jgi:hypothetical protein